MQFYELDVERAHLPCSEVIRDNLTRSRCSNCSAALTWSRKSPLVLEYNREDDNLHILTVEYQYLIVRAQVCESMLTKHLSGMQISRVKVKPRADDYEAELVQLNDVKKQTEFWRSLHRPTLYTVDFMKAGVVRVFDVDFTTIINRPVSDQDVCPECGRIIDRELLYTLLERKVVIDTTNWNGADCFAVGHLGVVCTQKVVDALSEASARGWTAKPIESITC